MTFIWVSDFDFLKLLIHLIFIQTTLFCAGVIFWWYCKNTHFRPIYNGHHSR